MGKFKITECFTNTISRLFAKKNKTVDTKYPMQRAWVWKCDCGSAMKITVVDPLRPFTLDQMKGHVSSTMQFGAPIVMTVEEARQFDGCFGTCKKKNQ